MLPFSPSVNTSESIATCHDIKSMELLYHLSLNSVKCAYIHKKGYLHRIFCGGTGIGRMVGMSCHKYTLAFSGVSDIKATEQRLKELNKLKEKPIDIPYE